MSNLIAALALLVAVYVGVRQILQGRRLEALEEGRRRDELTPRFSVECRVEKDGRVVEIVSQGPQDLDDVSFELVFSVAGAAPVAAVLIGNDPHPIVKGSVGSMAIGQSRLLLAALEPTRTRQDQRMVLAARKGNDQWKVSVEFQVPPDVIANIY